MVLLSCCVEKQGYYDSGEESIIALICDITWTGGKKEYEDGSSWEIYLEISIKMEHIHEPM